jgi:CRP-like cAMP-binding protein
MRRSLQKRIERFTTSSALSSCPVVRQRTSLFSSATATTRTSKATKIILPLDPVLSQREKLCERAQPWLQVIGHASYLALMSGFLMTDMLQLRVALVGGYTGLVAFHTLHPRPLKIPLRWSAIFILVNAGAACMLAVDRWGAPLSDDDEKLYLDHFSTLTRGQFYQLLSLGNIQEIPDGKALTAEGEVCETLYFILEGKAKVYHHKAFAANIDAGGFVNDVAFQRGEGVGAYGTIITSGKCSLIMWDQSKLRDHLRSRPEMDRNMKYCLSNHLVKSLLRQREAAHQRQQQWISSDISNIIKRDTNASLRRSPSQYQISWEVNK